MMKKETYSLKLQRLIEFYGLKQLVNEPTRTTQNSETLIDLCLTNHFELEAKVLHYPKITDHSLIKICVNNKQVVEKETKKVKCFKNYSKNKLNEELRLTDWSVLKDLDLSEKCDFIQNSVEKCAYKLIKDKYIQVNNNNKWFNNELRQLRKEKSELYINARMSFNDELWNLYKNKRNAYDNKLKQTKNNFLHRKIENCGKNQKEIWKTLKSEILPTKLNNSLFESIDFNGVIETHPELIAEKFNCYFVESIKEINISIPDVSMDSYEIDAVSSVFKFQKINFDKLNNILKKLKFTNDVKKLNKTLIEDSLPVTSRFVIDVINESLETGEFPRCLKNSIIIPIQKKNGTIKSDEFRPINTLQNFEKVFESEVKNQLQDYILENKILVEEQSGFRKQHSCETALNLVLADWKFCRDDGEKTIVVFLDLRRAFETLDRRRLLKKLEKYGIHEEEQRWFKSYLEKRTQSTKIGEIFSKEITNDLGVPQGSVLGPLLFILYINDIVKVLKFCKSKLFADDACIYISGKNCEEIIWKLNDDLERINTWLNLNKLKINIEKTVFMFLSNKVNKSENNINVKINNEQLTQVKETKYLGIIIDDQLNFKSNYNYIIKKISKKINFLSRIRNKMNRASKCNIYSSIIAAHIEFCSSVLFLGKQIDFTKLQQLQNKGMRIILDVNRFTPIKAMLDCLCWMSVKQRVYFNTMCLIFKIVNRMLPHYLFKKIEYVKNVQNYNLRNGENFRIKRLKQVRNQNNLYHKGLDIYNNIPNNIKNCKNLREFKSKLKPYIKCNF